MIKTERLLLRPLKNADIPKITELLQNKDVSRYTERIPYPYSGKDAADFFEKHRKDKYTLAVTLGGDFIGAVSLQNIFKGRAELGYWLGKPYWRRGIMTEAVQGVLKYFSEEIDLMTSRVAVGNIGSQRVLEKSGFKKLAMLPRHHRNFEGEVSDEYLYYRNTK